MDAEIKAKAGPQVLDDASERFAIERSSLHELSDADSVIYAGRRRDHEVVLRLSHSSHRSATEILGEIDWVNYLAANGVNACRALPSEGGEFIEKIGTESDYFTATAFERAPGDRPNAEHFQPKLFEEMGCTMGRMHVLTKAYVPLDPLTKRPQWFDDVTAIYRSPPETANRHAELLLRLHALPKNRETYGLVHLDFHRANFFVHEDRVHLFDFYDCQYSWFADDIAMALFYAVPRDCTAPEHLEFARMFMRHFLDGYRTQHQLDAERLFISRCF